MRKQPNSMRQRVVIVMTNFEVTQDNNGSAQRQAFKLQIFFLRFVPLKNRINNNKMAKPKLVLHLFITHSVFRELTNSTELIFTMELWNNELIKKKTKKKVERLKLVFSPSK